MEDIERLRGLIEGLGDGRRLIAIAGPPGAGKSHLAAGLSAAIPGAALVPMDGFHLDNSLLDLAGLRDRKGSPESFDAAGFLAMVQRLKAGGAVVYPQFDRVRDLAIAGAGLVEASCQTVIIEGNYLLLDRPIWRELAPLWDLSVMLSVPDEILKARLQRRWQELGCQPAEVGAHLANDLANAALVVGSCLPAGVVLSPWGGRP